MTPVRIQRKRTKGWKMPPNTIYVGRPTIYGNPFKEVGDMIYGDASHRRKILSPWIYIDAGPTGDVVELYKDWITGIGDQAILSRVRPCPFTIEDIKKELGGKNLACFCCLECKCHASVLLKISNS